MNSLERIWARATGHVMGESDHDRPERILVVPAYGVDFSYVYENTGKVTGAEW